MKRCSVWHATGRSAFSNKQWKRHRNRRCKHCIDKQHQRPKEENQASKEKKRQKRALKAFKYRQRRERKKKLEADRKREEEKTRNDQKYGKDLCLVSLDKQDTIAYTRVSKFVDTFTNPVQHLTHDQQWRPSEYLVSEKADGQRCLVLCSCDGNVWCLRPRQTPLRFRQTSVSTRFWRAWLRVHWTLYPISHNLFPRLHKGSQLLQIRAHGMCTASPHGPHAVRGRGSGTWWSRRSAAAALRFSQLRPWHRALFRRKATARHEGFRYGYWTAGRARQNFRPDSTMAFKTKRAFPVCNWWPGFCASDACVIHNGTQVQMEGTVIREMLIRRCVRCLTQISKRKQFSHSQKQPINNYRRKKTSTTTRATAATTTQTTRLYSSYETGSHSHICTFAHVVIIIIYVLLAFHRCIDDLIRLGSCITHVKKPSNCCYVS